MSKKDKKSDRTNLQVALEFLGLAQTADDTEKQAKKAKTVVAQKVDRQGNIVK